MKVSEWLLAAVLLSLLGPAGCKKAPAPGLPHEHYGVTVDWPKLDSEFAGSTDPELVASAALVKRAFMYHQFGKAMVELDKLASNPKLNDSQRKLVNQLLEQTKQVLAKAPPSG